MGTKGSIDMRTFEQLRKNAGDRGRDGGRFQSYNLPNGLQAILGNWRATPTPEIQKAPLQPYFGVVHNGTIANDKELGALPEEVDSMVLPRILERSTSLRKFAASISRIKGSFAIAAVTPETIYLACNYKPIYYWKDGIGTVFFSSMARHFNGVVSDWASPKKMEPYSVLDLRTGEGLVLDRKYEQKAVVAASSGLDSTVVATQLLRNGWEVRLLQFWYGCRAEEQEEAHLMQIAMALGIDYSMIPLDYSGFGAHSTILDGPGREVKEIGGPIEGSEYAVDWVPARNLVMLAHMTAFAESNGFHVVALGNNLEEAGAYPDNEEEFTNLFGQLLPYSTQNGYRIDILSPVGNLMKHEIVKLGLGIRAPLEHTWSCYRNENVHCGKCGPCFMRKEAFRRNKVKDPAFLHEWMSDEWKDCADYPLTEPAN